MPDHADTLPATTRPPALLPPALAPLVQALTASGRPPRVVIDTPTVLSALLFGGATATRLRRGWRHGYCRPLVCKATSLLLMQALADRTLSLSPEEQQRLLREYLPYALKVRVPEADRAVIQGAPAGVALLHLAQAGKAHVLVSGDAELLALAGRLPCAVLSLDAFLTLLQHLPTAPLPRLSTPRPIRLG